MVIIGQCGYFHVYSTFWLCIIKITSLIQGAKVVLLKLEVSHYRITVLNGLKRLIFIITRFVLWIPINYMVIRDVTLFTIITDALLS